MLCAKFLNDWTTERCVMDEWDFMRLGFKMSFWLSYIAEPPSIEPTRQHCGLPKPLSPSSNKHSNHNTNTTNTHNSLQTQVQHKISFVDFFQDYFINTIIWILYGENWSDDWKECCGQALSLRCVSGRFPVLVPGLLWLPPQASQAVRASLDQPGPQGLTPHLGTPGRTDSTPTMHTHGF